MSDKTIPQQLADLTQQLTAAQSRVTELETKAAAAAKQVESLTAQVTELQGKLTAAEAAVADRDQKLAAKDAEIGTLSAKVQDTERKLALHPEVAALFARGADTTAAGGGGEASDQPTGEALLKQYNALPPRERAQFYRDHKSEFVMPMKG